MILLLSKYYKKSIKKHWLWKKRDDIMFNQRLNYLIILIIFILVCSFNICYGQDNNIFLKDSFETLDNWESLLFPKIKEHSVYKIEKKEIYHYLRAQSNASASGLLLKREFNVYQYPNVRWRWRIENIYKRGNAKEKSGDDYPIRIYIIFKYEPEKANFLDKIKYNFVKLFYGKYPPHSSLNYIWANRDHMEKVITSPYTDRSKMISHISIMRKI